MCVGVGANMCAGMHVCVCVCVCMCDTVTHTTVLWGGVQILAVAQLGLVT